MYYDLVRKIAKNIIDKMAEISIHQDHVWEDEDLAFQVLHGETKGFATNYGMMLGDELTIHAAALVAGHSMFIEASYNGRYRKDSFRDVAWGALLADVVVEVKESHPEWMCDDPCDRGR